MVLIHSKDQSVLHCENDMVEGKQVDLLSFCTAVKYQKA
jgi:hypothetical protein